MDPLRRSSRVLKITQEDIEFNVDQQQHRTFNVIPAQISRPPSSCGSGNRLTKIQKVKPTNIRKRRKWDNRFHIESHPAQIHKYNKSQKKQKKEINKHSKSKMHSTSIIPPIDVITGKREWGKKNKKRAKWSMMKNKYAHSVGNNMIVNNKSKQRAKWINTNKLNHLRTLQNESENKEEVETRNMCINTEKNQLQNKQQILLQHEEEKENEELHDMGNKSEFDNKQRATKRLLPISNKNKLNHKRKQYLKPLDKVADIILHDLIENASEELDTFCCELVDALIHSETNVTNC